MVTWGEFKAEIDKIIKDDQRLHSIMMDFKSDQFGHGIDKEEGFLLTDQIKDIYSTIPFPSAELIKKAQEEEV